jgi:hypothetical protein
VANLTSCIDLAVKDKKIKQETADQLKTAEDPNSAILTYMDNLSRVKREAAIQAVRLDTAIKAIDAHPVSGYDGLVSLMAKDPTGQAKSINVDYLSKYYMGKYHSKFAEALDRFRTKRAGFAQDKEGLEKLVEAIYGNKVDDPEIMEFAKAWREITEEIRQDVNAMGGSIHKNESWLLPQMHDMETIRKVTNDDPEVWKNDIRKFLDRSKMTDDQGKLLTDADFEAALDYTYQTIITGGLNKLQETLKIPRVGHKLSRAGSQKRFLYFKDAESWMAYSNKYGRGDIFSTLTDYINTQANDIALLEVLGTNPDDAYKVLKEYTRQKHGMKQRQAWMADAIFDVVSGKANRGELTTLADFMQSVKNVLTASKLGSAFLAAISDESFTAMTARYNNIPAVKVAMRKLSLANSPEARRFAVTMGLTADSWINHAQAGNRFADIYGVGPTAKLAEGVLRASLLSGYTSAGRKAFGMEFSAMLAENFSKTLDELDPNLKRAFETYNISSKDWDKFRKTKALDFEGAQFADLTKDTSRKFHQMVLSETDYAVPTPDARVRAITSGGMGRATIGGQAWRAAMMLKSFPITVMSTHMYRMAFQSTMADKLSYTATLAMATTVMGGVALQAKEVGKGREPRNIDESFLIDAFAQGGMTGMLGDYTLSDLTRYGSSPTQTLIGPVGQLIDDTYDLTVGNVREAVAGEETNVLGEGVKYTKGLTPTIWQTKLFTNALYDQIELAADPQAQKKFNDVIRKHQREYDTGYWWNKGELTPEALQ